MKRCFTSLTALLCSAAILLCSLPMQALAAEFWMQTAYEDVLPDELTAQKEAPEAEKQPEAAPEEPTVSVLSTDNRSGDFTYSILDLHNNLTQAPVVNAGEVCHLPAEHR